MSTTLAYLASLTQEVIGRPLPQSPYAASPDEASTHYKDPLRPGEEAFKAAYELGFDTWTQLYKATLENRSLSHEQLSIESLIANHPRVPGGAKVDDTGFLTAGSLWSSGGSCDLPLA